MIFLLTNDDGIQSEKLQYTKSILENYGTVYTVAPQTEQSAKGMSLTIGGFHVNKINEYNYAVEGTPVDCVNYGLQGLRLNPDIIVSGTNNGYNIGIDTKYSGTVGACFQGQYFGYPTIAFSADRRGNTVLEKELEKTLKYILENNLQSKDYTLNVNFPREKFIDGNGLRLTSVHYHMFDFTPEMVGNKFIPNRSYIRKEGLQENTDTWAYIKGFTSISKIRL